MPARCFSDFQDQGNELKLPLGSWLRRANGVVRQNGNPHMNKLADATSIKALQQNFLSQDEPIFRKLNLA
jgi:hypothetical protein